MFDIVRRNNKLFQILLFLLIFPSFVLFGIQGYDRMRSASDYAAKVGQGGITMDQLEQAQREVVARAQQQGGADVSGLDTPQARLRTLDQLVQQSVLQQSIRDQRLQAPDSQVQQAILQIPQIAALHRPDGSFDVDAYRQLLQAQGMTPEQFEAEVRGQILTRQVLGGIGANLIESRATAARLDAWQSQTRSVKLSWLPIASFAAQAQPTAAQMQDYYRQHQAAFQVPAQAEIEYVVLTPDAMRKAVSVTPQQVKQYYDQHMAQFGGTEQRSASHILITVPSGATPAQQQAAKAKADSILAEVRHNPAQFAAIAKRDSQDPGSAANGGSLGYFAHDAMVAPFADAVFALHKAGEIAGPVQSQYGYHIIMLTGIRAAKPTPFADVQGKIAEQLAQQQLVQRQGDIVDRFSNTVYEDSRSFAKVAASFGLTVGHASGVTALAHGGNPAADPLASPKLLQSLFGANSVRDQRNVPAVEIAPQTWASARIVSYKPAVTPAFEQVQDKVKAALVQARADQLAADAGARQLAQLRSGQAQPTWGPSQTLSQLHPDAKLPLPLQQAAFSTDASKLPAFGGVAVPGQGYALIRVDQVTTPAADPARDAAFQQQLTRSIDEAGAAAYLKALKDRIGVEIRYKAQPKQS